jgi:hypothetical protein
MQRQILPSAQRRTRQGVPRLLRRQYTARKSISASKYFTVFGARRFPECSCATLSPHTPPAGTPAPYTLPAPATVSAHCRQPRHTSSHAQRPRRPSPLLRCSMQTRLLLGALATACNTPTLPTQPAVPPDARAADKAAIRAADVEWVSRPEPAKDRQQSTFFTTSPQRPRRHPKSLHRSPAHARFCPDLRPHQGRSRPLRRPSLRNRRLRTHHQRQTRQTPNHQSQIRNRMGQATQRRLENTGGFTHHNDAVLRERWSRRGRHLACPAEQSSLALAFGRRRAWVVRTLLSARPLILSRVPPSRREGICASSWPCSC